MDEQNRYNSRFFKYIDNPPMVGLFEVDEFIVFMSLLIGQMMTDLLFGLNIDGGILIYPVTAGMVALSYIKYKKNKPKGYFFQKLYRLGIYEPRNWVDPKSMLGLKRQSKKYKNFKVLPYGFVKKMSGS